MDTTCTCVHHIYEFARTAPLFSHGRRAYYENNGYGVKNENKKEQSGQKTRGYRSGNSYRQHNKKMPPR
eukprot:4285195-Amphidinium_carterae.1